MAKLRQCKDCGQMISKRAKSCPHCGAPVKRISGCAWLVLGFLSFFFLIIFIMTIFNIFNPQEQPQERMTRRPAPTPTPNFAPIEKIAGYQIPSKNKRVLDRYKEISQIAEKAYGWFVVECTDTLCGESDGFLVAFRVITDIGEILPIWHVSKDFMTLSWINGKAHGETPELPQKTVPDISIVVTHFKEIPETSAFVLRQKNTP